MAGIIYDAGKIEKALKPLRCRKLGVAPFKGKLVPEHDIWETAWGHKFMVPNQGCAHWLIAEIIETEVKGTRPKDWHEH